MCMPATAKPFSGPDNILILTHAENEKDKGTRPGSILSEISMLDR